MMKPILVLTLSATLCLPLPRPAQAQQVDRKGALTFESSGSGQLVGWHFTPDHVFLDSTVVHGGRYAARLEQDPTASGGAVLTLSVPVTFQGTTVALHGWLKTDGVTGFAGLWLREDGKQGMLRLDNMQEQHLTGTKGWAEYRIELPLDGRARTLYMGALLAGGGTVWADDLELQVDGGAPEDAPPYVHVPDSVELDTEFDSGSGIVASSLSAAQIANLALLGRVWGFVKYHHPRVTGGNINWDYELFRVMPEVLRAPDHTAAEHAISAWLARAGDPKPCGPCAKPPIEPQLAADVGWIHDDGYLGTRLRRQLEAIYANRSVAGEQYYVATTPVGNPDFSGEGSYQTMPTPDAGFRLLGLFRFWDIIEYWFPYRNLLDDKWTDVLTEFIPRFMAAEGHDDYRLVMMQLIARAHDTHANLWSDLGVRPPTGTAQLPVVVRFVEGKAVVTGYSNATAGPASGLRVGDVIESLDGAAVDSLVEAWRPYYADSNEAARLRDMGRQLTRGSEGPVRVRGSRASGPFDATARRISLDSLDGQAGATHDLPGEAFQMLTPEVAYLKLSSVKAAECADYVRRAAGASVLVIDIRNYPSEFVVFALGNLLASATTPFARFTRGDPANPGAFTWTEPVSLQPAEPHFGGKVVVLVDEVSQSQAEYTTMAFRAAGATVVGSTTAGADGNVSTIPLPGGLRSLMSGIGVFYPDDTPTQRVGIVPDLVVRPTIAGIREGRDEVLEAAVSRALGRPFSRARR